MTAPNIAAACLVLQDLAEQRELNLHSFSVPDSIGGGHLATSCSLVTRDYARRTLLSAAIQVWKRTKNLC